MKAKLFAVFFITFFFVLTADYCITYTLTEITPLEVTETLNGISWYGLDSTPSWYKLNTVDFATMINRFPNGNLIVLPFSVFSYSDTSKLELLQNFVSIAGANDWKVIISNYWTTLNEATITAFWENMTTLFAGNSAIEGFDLINEPWDFDYGDTGLTTTYENIIDAIRALDPTRKCYVQSYLYHQEGYDWIATNPVNKTNIEYITHIYDTDFYAATPSWLSWSVCGPYYQAGNYATGKSVLQNQLEDRFKDIMDSEGVDFAVTELCSIDTPAGHQYLTDLTDILTDWGCDYAYAHYFSPNVRPCCLLDQYGNARGMIDWLNTIWGTEEEPPAEPPIEPPPSGTYVANMHAGAGGVVHPTGWNTVSVGTPWWCVATAATDYKFDYWSVNGINKGSDRQLSLPSLQNNGRYEIWGYFTDNTPAPPDPPSTPETGYYSVNIGTCIGGSTDLTGEQTLMAGQPLIVEASPNENYRFSYWLLDGSNWGTSRTFTLTGTADTTYRLSPVFTYVPSPPPNEPFIPPAANVGVLSNRRMLSRIMRQSVQQPQPIDIDELFKTFKRMKL